jgi:ribulose kinase
MIRRRCNNGNSGARMFTLGLDFGANSVRALVHYEPNEASVKADDRLYRLYREVSDGFRGVTKSADLSRVMKDLIAIKYAQRATA